MKSFIGLLLLFPCLLLSQEDFEGIIIYTRTPNYQNPNGVETYYFGNGKVLVETSNFLDSVFHYTTLLLIHDQINKLYNLQEGRVIDVYEIDPNNLTIINSNHTEPPIYDSILNYQCQKIVVDIKPLYHGSHVRHERWVANNLYFTIPDEWYLDRMMISHLDNRITLKLKEMSHNDELEPYGGRGYTIIWEAIAVVPMDLPNDLFESVEN